MAVFVLAKTNEALVDGVVVGAATAAVPVAGDPARTACGGCCLCDGGDDDGDDDGSDGVEGVREERANFFLCRGRFLASMSKACCIWWLSNRTWCDNNKRRRPADCLVLHNKNVPAVHLSGHHMHVGLATAHQRRRRQRALQPALLHASPTTVRHLERRVVAQFHLCVASEVSGVWMEDDVKINF